MGKFPLWEDAVCVGSAWHKQLVLSKPMGSQGVCAWEFLKAATEVIGVAAVWFYNSYSNTGIALYTDF